MTSRFADAIRELLGTHPHDLDLDVPFRIKGRRYYIPEFNPLWCLIYILGAVIGAFCMWAFFVVFIIMFGG